MSYVIGGPIDETEDFYGRRALMDAIFQSRAPFCLLGLYRSGKTSLLKALAREAPAHGMVPLYLPLHEHLASMEDLRSELLALQVEDLLLDLGEASATLDLDALAEASVQHLLNMAQRAARAHNLQLLLLVDEIGVFVRLLEQEQERPALGLFRGWLQQKKSVRTVLTGPRRARQLQVAGERDESDAFLAGFRVELLEPGLDPVAARNLLTQSLRGGRGVQLTERDFRRVYEDTGGMAILLQCIGDAMQRGAGSLEAAYRVLASKIGDAAFRQNLNMISPSERRILDHIRLGQPPLDDDHRLLQSLCGAGYLSTEGAPTIPLMFEYLDQHGGWSVFPALMDDEHAAPGLATAASSIWQEPPEADATEGRCITYRLEAFLGGGGFGEVYRARLVDDDIERVVAIKILLDRWLREPKVAERMRDEARILARLAHPAIVRVEQLCQVERRPAVIMEYVEGADLAELIALGEHVPRLPARGAAEIISDVASALHAAYFEPTQLGAEIIHVTHRDIKPGNIRLTRLGKVKVLDFGLAFAEFEAREAESQASTMGTWRYMAPERTGVWGDPQSRLPASDIYSLGLVLVELATGDLPKQPQRDPDEDQRLLDTALAAFPPDWAPLAELARRMLAWDHTARPTAQMVAREAWRIVRESRGTDLRDWAEVAVSAALGLVPPPAEHSLLSIGLLQPEGVLGWTGNRSQPTPPSTSRFHALALRKAGRGLGWQVEAWSDHGSELFVRARPSQAGDLGDWATRELPVLRQRWLMEGGVGHAGLHDLVTGLEARLRTPFRQWLAANTAQGPLRLVTDLAEVPWELLRLGSDEIEALRSAALLGTRCAVGRQYEPGLHEDPLPAPSQRPAEIKRALILHDGAHENIAESADLLQRLEALGVETRVFGLRGDGVAMLRWCTSGVDLVHVACRDLALNPGDGSLMEGSMLGDNLLLPQLEVTRPVLVFLNACSSLVGATSGAGMGAPPNLAARWALRHCPLVVGTLWPVDGEAARRLADVFYGSLVQGALVGEALRTARLEIQMDVVSDDWQSWAAYVLYGDPTCAVTVAGTTPSPNHARPFFLAAPEDDGV